MRRFTDQAIVGGVMNWAHLCFTLLFNVAYGTHLRDPFTMYKVFRRDCLSGLTFEANRFDFDWELLGKLVRAGYTPIEIPVNYRSRPFSEGKNAPGRNHNPYGFSMWLAGGGVKGGLAYGATDEFGFAAVENKVHVHDLHATILHLMGIDHTRLTYRYSGRDFRLTDVHGNVVKDILA